MTKPNNFLAIVVLTEEDKNRVHELCNKYSSKSNFLLHDVFCNLYHEEITKNDMLDGISIRHLLEESDSEANSVNLRKIIYCIAKGFFWCSEEELKDAGIKY